MGEPLGLGMPLSMPLYKEVKRRLIEALVEGEWKPGAALPAERLLAERFGVAIGTLRKAVDELVAETVLIRHQGRGTFVAVHNRERQRFQFLHIVRHDGVKILPTVGLVSFGRGQATAAEAAQLQVAAKEPLFRIRNLLSIEGQPVVVDHIAVPQRLLPGLTRARFAGRPNTIYHLYQTVFGITVARTRERLRAVPADADSARLLAVADGAPLLEIRRVALTISGQPVEVRRSLVNSAEHEYASEIAGS